MDLDLSLLSAVVRNEGDYFLAKRDGIITTMLEGVAIGGWEFIEDHVLQYGKVPSEEFFSAKTGIELDDPPEDTAILINDLKDRVLWNKLKAAHESSSEFLGDNCPKKALDVLQKAVQLAYSEGIAGGKIGNLLSLGDEVVEYYDRIKNGERGISSPWQAMSDMTQGWWGGDFVVFVARMSVGKTFAMLMLALTAWLEGKKVLFVGTEMTRMKLAFRFYALHLKLPYNEFRKGQLGTLQESKMRESIENLSKEDGIDVVGDDFNAEIKEIELAVEQVRPDILFVDGLYLVKNLGKSRHERVSNTADDLTRLAKRHDIPVIASTQFNRDVASNSRTSVDAANVGITDVIGWNCSVMFALFQTEDMKEDKIMGFRPLKLREGEGHDFFSKWDFGTMDFSQDDIDTTGDFQDGDYDYVPESEDGEDDDDTLF